MAVRNSYQFRGLPYLLFNDYQASAHHSAGSVRTENSYLHVVPKVNLNPHVWKAWCKIMYRESFGDRDSSVGVVTRYSVEGPGSNTSLAEIFRPVQTGLEAHSVQWIHGLFSGGKAAGAWR